MENFIVSARKYRPATFDTVVGQNALTATLKNAIATNKLAHAYLFCGPRGVGKTTCARIFAKTINCLTPTAQGESCNTCESCVAFTEQRSYNIYELDAASNNSVEDIKQLIDMVRIPPQVGKYKVFIIDEVHMLSSTAFNAFLKTLEEPPAHAIFILATTEKHKIIPTILSRCQIYDFNRIGVNDIVDHLKEVAAKEGVTAELEALNIIALKADGGMRDALSIFDQAVSYTRGNITYQGVLENLNVLDYDYYFRLTDSFLEGNNVDILLLFNEILNKGFEGSHFINGLTSHFRDLLVSKDESTLPLLEVGATIRERYAEQAKKCNAKFLLRAMKLCNDCDLDLRTSNNKRLLIELTLLQVSQLTDEGEGERPLGQSKQLKPVFKASEPQAKPAKKQEVKPQVQSQTKQTETVAKEAQESYKKSTVAKPQAAPKAKPVAQKEKSREPDTSLADRLKNAGTGRRAIPVVKEHELGVSLRGVHKKLTKNQRKEETQAEAAAQQIHKEPFTEDELNFYWQSFINYMPIEQKALAVRMRGMRVKLMDEQSFEMVVDNDYIANEYKEIRGDIQQYLRENLRNDFVEMNIRISEASENTRVLSRSERFTMMAEKNSSLYELQKEFGLEFY